MVVSPTDGEQGGSLRAPGVARAAPRPPGCGTAMGGWAEARHGGAQQMGQHPPHQGPQGCTEAKGHHQDPTDD